MIQLEERLETLKYYILKYGRELISDAVVEGTSQHEDCINDWFEFPVFIFQFYFYTPRVREDKTK